MKKNKICADTTAISRDIAAISVSFLPVEVEAFKFGLRHEASTCVMCEGWVWERIETDMDRQNEVLVRGGTAGNRQK